MPEQRRETKRLTTVIVLSLFTAILSVYPLTPGERIEDFRVNEEDYPSPFYQLYPSVSVSGTGDFVVVWCDMRYGRCNVHAQRYDSCGNPLGGNFKVDDDTLAFSHPSVSADFDGKFVVVWTDGRNGRADIYAQRYDSAGCPLGGDFRVNDDTARVIRGFPQVALDLDGDFVIVWSDRRSGSQNIYGQRYGSTGVPLGPNFRIDDDTTGAHQAWPSVGTDAVGDFVVAWQDGRAGRGTFDVYAQRFDSGGSPVGNNFLVNDDTSGALVRPSVSCDTAWNFVVTWTDERDGSADIYAQRYDNAGNRVGTNFRVNDDVGQFFQGWPSVSLDYRGDFVVTWKDDREGIYNIYAQRYDSSGNPVGGNFRVDDDTTAAGQDWPSVSLAPRGEFVLAWSDNRNGDWDTYAQIYEANGPPLGSNFKANADTGGAWQLLSSIAVSADGHFVIAWTDGRNYSRTLDDIYAQGYDPDGNALGSNFKVNDDSLHTEQWSSSIASDQIGNFVVCWLDERTGYDIYAQRYDSWGNPLGQNFRVNDDVGVPSGYGDSPSISMDWDGNFVVSWSDARNGNFDIYCQRYDSGGSPVADNFIVNDDTVGLHQLYPSIAISFNGFVIAWMDWRDGALNIYAQRYDREGNAIGANFKVNDDTTGVEETHPSVAMASGGDFIMSWSDLRDGDLDIYWQRYDRDGNPVGCNSKANDDVTGVSQREPSVSFAPGGDFVVTWSDWRNGDADPDVYCQAYQSDGTPIGTNFRVNSDAEGNLQDYSHAAIDEEKNIYFTWTDNRTPGDLYDIFAKVIGWDEIPGTGEVEPPITRLLFSLYQNHPNPFASSTAISYVIPASSPFARTTLKVYDLSGRLVSTLVDEGQRLPGSYSVYWDGTDGQERSVASGIYFINLESGTLRAARKAVLLR